MSEPVTRPANAGTVAAKAATVGADRGAVKTGGKTVIANGETETASGSTVRAGTVNAGTVTARPVSAGAVTAGTVTTSGPSHNANGGNELLSIGAAASLLGISERSLRYYQQLGLITPCGRTPGGMRRYSEADLARVARIRELQTLLGLNLDEISVVLRNDDRMAEIREQYRDERTGAEQRTELARECLVLQQQLRATVEQKRGALDRFLADVDARIDRIRAVLSSDSSDTSDTSDSSRG